MPAQDSGSASPSTSRATADELMGAFRRALGLGPGVAPAEIVRGSLSEWDSVGHMELVVEIESTFGIRIADDDVLALDSFDRALAIVEASGGADG